MNVGNRAHIGRKINNKPGIRSNKSNIYQRPENRARIADRSTAQKNLKQARSASGRDNHVFAGNNGGVARKVGNDWQTPKDGQWKTDADLNQRATTGTQKTANTDTRHSSNWSNLSASGSHTCKCGTRAHLITHKPQPTKVISAKNSVDTLSVAYIG